MLNRSSEIVFIGAGKVAHSIVPLLIRKNYSVKGVISRSMRSARSLSKKYNLNFCSDKLKSIPLDVKVFFITVPDNQISTTADKLSVIRNDFKNCLFVHTSGSEGSSALKVIENKGGMTASFHIMQTFPSTRQTDVRNSFAAIETKFASAERYLFSLGRNLNLKSFKLNEEEKVYYHMAGVFTANFMNANFFASEKLLERTELTVQDHYNIFETIINTTLANIKNSGSAHSLSGPVQRGDSQTVNRHVKALEKLKPVQRKMLLQSYAAQSMVLLELIKGREGKLNPGQKEIKKILTAAIKKI